MRARFLVTVAVFAFTAGAAPAGDDLTSLHRNDVHARFEPINGERELCRDEVFSSEWASPIASRR